MVGQQERVLSWNINGLRSLGSDMRSLLTGLTAGVLCFQETKVTRDMLEEPHAIVEGFSSYFSFSRKRSGYSGVATFCSQEATPFAAQEGLSGLYSGELSHGAGTREALAGQWVEEELKDLDSEGRTVITQHSVKDKAGRELEVAIINVYCPRVDPEKPERRVFKLRFYELLRQRAAAIRATGCHVIIVGDINTSHRRIDHCDPDETEDFENRVDRRYLDKFLMNISRNEKNLECKRNLNQETGTNLDGEKKPNIITNDGEGNTFKDLVVAKEKINCSDKVFQSTGTLVDHTEVNVFSSSRETRPDTEENLEDDLLLSATDFQVVDTFRYYHPHRKEAYTCWNTLTNARSTNYGTRIDYLLCDQDLLAYTTDSLVLQDVMGSDHCPVAVDIEGTFVPADKLPYCCTKFFPEFRGLQQKLSSYFQPRSSAARTCLEKVIAENGTHTSSVTGKELVSAKRKVDTGKGKSHLNKKKCSEKQMTLGAFFVPKFKDNSKTEEEVNQRNSQKSDGIYHSESSESTMTPPCSQSSDELSSQETLQGSQESNPDERRPKPKNSTSSSWSFLMKAPKPPPLCPGHKEPCVAQTVKKKGPNLNRQFYACARGVGKEGDPNARCKFFKWAS